MCMFRLLCKRENTVQGSFTLNVNDWLRVWELTLASYLINWGRHPFLERFALFSKKSKRFNQSGIASGITTLTLTLSVKGSLVLPTVGCNKKPLHHVSLYAFRKVRMIVNEEWVFNPGAPKKESYELKLLHRVVKLVLPSSVNLDEHIYLRELGLEICNWKYVCVDLFFGKQSICGATGTCTSLFDFRWNLAMAIKWWKGFCRLRIEQS